MGEMLRAMILFYEGFIFIIWVDNQREGIRSCRSMVRCYSDQNRAFLPSRFDRAREFTPEWGQLADEVEKRWTP